ncbi:hypothetical protein BC940DRAFT_306439 [Gongronella butleri]|nr:hypothetical protein BC940DRAFT_306439 [Gongronella butleri]
MIDGTDPSLTAAAAAPSPRRWIIKKASKPSGGSPTTPTSPAVVVDTETDDSFDQKVELWARKRFSKRLAYHLCQDVHKDMQRRKQAQQGQQGQQLHQEQQQQQQEVLSSVNTTPDQQPDKQNTLFDLRAFDFQSPKQLAGRDYDMWIDHAHRDMHQPHQWLRLASLFHIHPKSQHQRSILDGPLRIASQIDRNVSRKVNDTPLEHYLALRQTQNRAYAIQA